MIFAVDKPTSWGTYSLNRQSNVSIAGNTTLTNLANGDHNITVYAKYAEGAIGASETVSFTVAKSESFPLAPVAGVSVAAVAVAGVGVAYYFKKHRP